MNVQGRLSVDVTQYFPIAEAVSLLLHPHAEVIIHDLATEKIVGIFNPFSKRKVGDESLLEESFDFSNGPNVIGPYSKVNWDGRKLKSITSVLRDSKGNVFGLMCINMDISAFDRFQKVIETFLDSSKMQSQPKSLFQNDWREKVNKYIDQHLKSRRLTLGVLTKNQQAELIKLLHKEGAFEGKNAAIYIAQVLGISRATVYNLLKCE